MEPVSAAQADFYIRFREWTISAYVLIVQHSWFAVLFPALLLTWGISQAVALAYLAYGISMRR